MAYPDDQWELNWTVAAFLRGEPPVHVAIRARLQQFVDRHYSADGAEREDLVAEVISILLASLRQGRFHGNNLKSFNSYIYGIARLVITQHVEKATRRDALNERFGPSDSHSAKAGDAHDLIANSDLLTRIHAQIGETCRT
jgi:DNA-directed RNA polymerase specialized sigma24 family protein